MAIFFGSLVTLLNRLKCFRAEMRISLLALAGIFSCIAIPSGLSAENCLMRPFSAEERIRGAHLIAEGEVVSAESYPGTARDMIYTAWTIRVSGMWKGAPVSWLQIITEGGTSGGLHVDVFPSTELHTGDKGIFLLTSLRPQIEAPENSGMPAYELYAGPQGFILKDEHLQSVYSPLLDEQSLPGLVKKFEKLCGPFHQVQAGELNRPAPSPWSEPFRGGYAYTSFVIRNDFYNFLLPPPLVVGFSPASLSAGTETVLTITGSGFGTTAGTVHFKDANAGGATDIAALASQIVSWMDTEVRVMVPSRAGTGTVRVTTSGGLSSTSATAVDITFSHLNQVSGSSAYINRLLDISSMGGISWKYHPSFSAVPAAVGSFERALETWRCATFINWEISPLAASATGAAYDGTNLVNYDSPGAPLPAGVLGACYTFRQSCGSSSGVNWYVSELDILFDNGTTWQYGPALPTGSQFDFESVALHELGHGHGLGHVIDASKTMHYSLGPAITKRALTPASEIAGGNWVMALSTAPAICGSPMVALTAGTCAVGAPNAMFSSSTITVCPGFTATFTDLSTGSPTSWNWTFWGGTPFTSTLANPVVTYSTPGVYDVRLIVTNAIGSDTIFKPAYITVAPPSAVISGTTSITPGSTTWLKLDLAGTPPWNVTITGGAVPIVLTGITSTPYYVPVSPSVTTTYSISVSNDAVCAGVNSGSATITLLPAPPVVAGTGYPVWPFASPGGTQSVRDWNAGSSGTFPFTNSVGGEASVALDNCGNPVFYAIHTGNTVANNLFLVKPDGTVLNPGNGFNSERFNLEVNIVQVPKHDDEWYIIYSNFTTNTSLGGSTAYYPTNHVYSRVRYRCDSLSILVKDSILPVGGTVYTYTHGRAVSKNVPGIPDAHYLYTCRRTNASSSTSLDRFIIDEAGIRWNANTGNISVTWYTLTIPGSFMDVSFDGSKIAVVYYNESIGDVDAIIWDAALFTAGPGGYENIIADNLMLQPAPPVLLAPATISAAGATAALDYLTNLPRKLVLPQFSPSGRYLYLSGGGYVAGGYTNMTYLLQIDMLSPAPHNVRIRIQYPPGGTFIASSGRGCGFSATCNTTRYISSVQSAYDGNLYFTRANNDSLWVIPDPDAVMFQTLVPEDINLATVAEPNIALASNVTQIPDHIDGYYYSDKGAEVELILSAVSCVPCLASAGSPVDMELTDASGNTVQCIQIFSCPDTVPLCVNKFKVYGLRFGGIYLDSVIVNGTVTGNPYTFGTASPVPVSMDTIGEVCDTASGIALSGYPAGGVFSGPGVTGAVFNPGALAPGVYTLFYDYTDSFTGCSGRDSIHVTVYHCCDWSPLTIAVTDVSCSGAGEIDVSSAGPLPPYLYSLDGGAWVTPGVWTIPIAGGHTVSIMDSTGCDTTVSVTVSGLGAPVVTILPLPSVCDTTAAVALSGSPAGGVFSGTGVVGTNFLPGFVATGTYTIYYSYTDPASGCTSADSTTLDVFHCCDWSPLNVNVTDVGCITPGGIDVSSAGPLSPYLYSLDGGAFVSPGVWVIPTPGSHTVTIQDSTGCDTTVSVTVGGGSAPVVTISPLSTVCDTTASVALSGSPAGGTFSGTGVSGTNFFPGTVAPGTYTIYYSYTDLSTGCTSSDSTTIDVFHCCDWSPVGVIATDPLCPGGTDGSITVTAGGPLPPYQYSFNGGPFGSANVFPGLGGGSYTVTVRDLTGCDTTLTITLNDPLPVPVSIDPPGTFCDTTMGVLLTASPVGGVFSGSGVSGSVFDPAAAGPGAHQVIYAWTQPGTGCIFSDTILIDVFHCCDWGTVSLTVNDAACAGGTGSVDVSVTGPLGPYLLSLDGGAFGPVFVFSGIAPGVHTLVLQDATGCDTTLSFTIAEPPALLLSTVSVVNESCNGLQDGSVTVSASGGTPGYEYSSDGVIWGTTPAWSGLAPGTYTLLVRDANGCTASVVATVTAGAAPVVDFSFAVEPCLLPAPVSFVNLSSSAVSFEWTLGDGNTSASTSLSHLYAAAGNYSVILIGTDVNGCRDTSVQMVTVNNLPVAAFITNPAMPATVPAGTEVQFLNQSTYSTQWWWDFGDGNSSSSFSPFHAYYSEGTYCVSLIAANNDNCRDTVSICYITVPGSAIWIPNAFTPNGDAINDLLAIYSTHAFKEFSFRIYDRWGALMYEAVQIEDFWDGKYHGTDVQEGGYTWRLVARTTTDIDIDQSGTILLMR